MRRFRFLLCLFAIVLAPAARVMAQDDRCLHRTLALNIFDSKGRLIRGLDPADFVGKFRGKPVKFLSVTPDNRPHRVAVLLDTSGTVLMQPDAEEWVTAHSIALHITQATLPGTSLALILFSEKVDEEIDFSKGATAAAKRLVEIGRDDSYAKEHLRGKTSVRDAVLAAMQLLGDASFSNSIYVIGDGTDNRSRSGAREVRDSLVSHGVRFYVSMLNFGTAGGLSGWSRLSEESDPKETSELAVASGGLAFGRLGVGPFRKSSYNLKGSQRESTGNILDSMYMGMTRNDLVEIELPQTVDNWSKWSLELSPGKRKAHKDWFAVYPEELAPCSALPH